MEAFGLRSMVWRWRLGDGPMAADPGQLGGWITDNFSWRWIYYVNLPFGIIALLLQGAFIPESPHQTRKIERIDYLGLMPSC